MRSILITGANKGVGRALVEAVLCSHDDTFVWLGARDLGRGEATLRELIGAEASWSTRAAVVQLDVTSERSVHSAVETIRAKLAGPALYGVVSNAGIGRGSGAVADLIDTNVLGLHRVLEATLPCLEPGGRVVHVTSAAGPSFVARCTAAAKSALLDPTLSKAALLELAEGCRTLDDTDAAFAARGYGEADPYGLSKALANAYTVVAARENPTLHINACTPGFIETDMTRGLLESTGKSARELGMKSPAEGTRAPMHLLFGELEGNGRYYGSDAVRSPLDRYRSPGDPAYDGP